MDARCHNEGTSQEQLKQLAESAMEHGMEKIILTTQAR